MRRESRYDILTWIALLVLLAITCGSSFVSMGRWNVVVNFGVAVLKALLVVLIFMHVGTGRPVIRLVAAAGFLWLALLFGLSATDFGVRGW